MEFSYRISKADYLGAWKLRLEGRGGPHSARLIVFWMVILLCLVALWTVVQRTSPQTQTKVPTPTAPASRSEPAGNATPAHSASPARSLLVNLAPFVVILSVWFFLLRRLGPTAVGSVYRKDPQMQGEFTAEVTPQGISVTNTAGASSRNGWSIYDYWREGKGLIVLVMRSGALTILNIAGLCDIERNELRGILASVLPKR
jgi:hypothetical protein